jgi:hypothetical protein
MNRSIHHQIITGKTRDPNEAVLMAKIKIKVPPAAHIMIMAEKKDEENHVSLIFPHGHSDRNDPHQAGCRGSSAVAARHL